MSDLIEVSYTGDILAHRRCRRAWSYEKYAGFNPYEQVQALEGRLVHQAMEWLTRTYKESSTHPTASQLRVQIGKYFRMLKARGFRTRFETESQVVSRICNNLYPNGHIGDVVRRVVESAKHTEYELKHVQHVLPAEFGGKTRMLLTGVLDVVVQERDPIRYLKVWRWTDLDAMEGKVVDAPFAANVGDLEIWDYKATSANPTYVSDYARQVATYAALYRANRGELPVRCVLFFINEETSEDVLLPVEISEPVIKSALCWTNGQVKSIEETKRQFEDNPPQVAGGGIESGAVDTELAKQCTACGFRFDCSAYRSHLRKSTTDIDRLNIAKN